MSAATASGSGSAPVGPGKGPGTPVVGKPRNTPVGPGGSGWSGSVVFSFVPAGVCIKHVAHIAHDTRIRGVRKSGEETRPHLDHPDPWRISAGFTRAKPGPYPDPYPDPPGPACSGRRSRALGYGAEVPRRARAPPSH